jgi:carbamoyl-phosphate synthase large subunit
VKADLSVLLTGAGAPGTRGTLYALRNNPDGIKIRTVGTDAKAGGIGRLWMDAFYQVPAPEEQSYVEALLSICKAEAVDLVIPQTTREIVAFARHKAAFEAAGARVMVADLPAIDVANHKWQLLKICERLNLPHPTYHLARSGAELIECAARLGYPGNPVVVKPPVSNGMRGFRILREGAWDVARFLAEKPSGVEVTLEELLTVLGRGAVWPDLLVTEYLPGAEYSVDAFAGSKVSVAVPRLRKAIRSGISFENELEYREDLIKYTLTLGQQIGLKYAFGFQFKLDCDGVAKVLECNPRIQGTMVASLFSGVNVIWMGVKEALGEPPETVPDRLQTASFHRFWGGVGIQGERMDEI